MCPNSPYYVPRLQWPLAKLCNRAFTAGRFAAGHDRGRRDSALARSGDDAEHVFPAPNEHVGDKQEQQ
jgi:hypothetical protein